MIQCVDYLVVGLVCPSHIGLTTLRASNVMLLYMCTTPPSLGQANVLRGMWMFELRLNIKY